MSNSASCINLGFTWQPNLVIHSGVHLSLHPNYLHQIVFAKFNLTNFYPSPYKWLVTISNTDLIKRAIDLEKSLSNLDVNKQVSVFNETLNL